MLSADGDLSHAPVRWIEFLSCLGEDPARAEQRFIARNFLLDEGVGAYRARSYLERERGAKDGYGSTEEWSKAHLAYLSELVNRDPGGDLPRRLDPADDVCPETFRRLPHDSPFLPALPNLPLIRVERVDRIAHIAQRREPKEVSEALKSYLENGGQDAASQLRDILDDWNAHAEVRPTYAAFLDDFRDVLGDEEESPPGWPDRLRDALGLLHHDPGSSGPIEVVVLRYPVSAVPTLRGAARGSHLLMPPCVLDGRFSAAFCPSPRGGLTGHVADLSADVVEPRREVVHPTVRLRANHVWRMGTITKPVERDLLPEARGRHLELLRNHAARPDYALGTDGDLR